MIKESHNKNIVKLTFGDANTDRLENNVGVRKGCVMSQTLFNFYLELLVRIRKSGKGVGVGDRKIGCCHMLMT